MQWLNLGDANTKYSHACVKGRQAHNKIKTLRSSNGVQLHDKEQVEKKILDFYKNLLDSATTSLIAVDLEVISAGKVRQREQQLQLIQPVTTEEVLRAIQGIDVNKAPGCDGINAYFFFINMANSRCRCN